MAEHDDSPRFSLERLKTVGDLVRQYGLLLLMLLLILNPGLVKSWVEKAGVRKFGDVEFSAADAQKVEKVRQDLNDNRQVIAKLGDELAAAQTALRTDGEAGEATRESLNKTREAIDYARRNEERISRSLRELQPLANKLEEVAGAPTGDWAIIFGGDVSLAAARDEVERLRRADLPDARVQVYLRANAYRTLARFPSREAAEAALESVKRLRSSAYLVNLGTWCAKAVEKSGYWSCE